MPHTIELAAETRDQTGKEKAKAMRRAGYVPANVYGHGVPPTPIKVEVKALEETLRHATPTTLIDLRIGPRQRRQCLIREVQRSLLRGEPIHVDFFAVRMDQKVKASVSLVMRGEAPAAKDSELLVIHPITQVTVEGLPSDMPEAIEVDVSGLAEADQAVHARDLHLPDGVALLDDPDEILVKVQFARGAVEPETALAEAAAVDEAEESGAAEPTAETESPPTTEAGESR